MSAAPHTPAPQAERTPSSYMLTWDATTPEGRKAAASFFKGLGTGEVLIPQTAAEKRAVMAKQLGEGFCQNLERQYGSNAFRDGKRAVPEHVAIATAEAVRAIAEAAVGAQHIIGKAA